MKLSDIIKKYRSENGISMATLSKMSGLSKGYISMLENGRNPRNNNPINPTIESLNKLSKAMNIELDELLKDMDADDHIVLSDETVQLQLTSEESTLLEMYGQLNHIGRSKAFDYISDLAENEKYTKDTVLSENSGTA